MSAPTPRPPILRDDTAEQVRQLAEPYVVRRIRVFRSTARAQARSDSDVDLLVDCEPGHGGFAFVGFCGHAERMIGRKADVVTERSLHPLARVLSEALPL